MEVLRYGVTFINAPAYAFWFTSLLHFRLYKYEIIQKRFLIMSQVEFIGCLAVYGLVFLGGLIALIKPIIKLNVNIQKLTDSISNLTNDNTTIKADIKSHEDMLNDHETRLTVIEKAKIRNQ